MSQKLRPDGTPYPPKTIENVFWEAKKAKDCAERIEAKVDKLSQSIFSRLEATQTTIPF